MESRIAIQKLIPPRSGEDSPFLLFCQIPTTAKKAITAAKILFNTKKFINHRRRKNSKIYGIKFFMNF